MLDVKTKAVTPEQMVTNTDGDLDYPVDTGDDVMDTVNRHWKTLRTHEEADRALVNVCPPQHLDLQWTYRKNQGFTLWTCKHYLCTR